MQNAECGMQNVFRVLRFLLSITVHDGMMALKIIAKLTEVSQ